MLLAIDIGNSNVSIGVFRGEELLTRAWSAGTSTAASSPRWCPPSRDWWRPAWPG